MKEHPEQRDGEVYLGNCTTEVFREIISWRSKRHGKIAFDVFGEPIDQRGWSEEYFPVFAMREEVEAGVAAFHAALPPPEDIDQ